MPFKNFEGKYFGPNQIKEVHSSNEKTYLGKPKLILVFEDGMNRYFPLEVIEKIITDKATDLNDLRERRVMPVIEKILVILLESELKKEDMEYAINTRLQLSINQSLDRAQEKQWGKKGYEITLMDVERVLTRNKEKKAKQGK